MPKEFTTIRQRIAINQSDLAEFLGISRSALNMHERGERFLPAEAAGKLAKIEVFLHESVETKTGKNHDENLDPAMVKLTETTKIEFQEHIDMADYRLKILRRRLHQMEAMHKTAIAIIQLINFLSNEKNNPKFQGEDDKTWLDIQRKKSFKKLEKSGTIAQEKIKLKINCLESEITHYTASLDFLND